MMWYEIWLMLKSLIVGELDVLKGYPVKHPIGTFLDIRFVVKHHRLDRPFLYGDRFSVVLAGVYFDGAEFQRKTVPRRRFEVHWSEFYSREYTPKSKFMVAIGQCSCCPHNNKNYDCGSHTFLVYSIYTRCHKPKMKSNEQCF